MTKVILSLGFDTERPYGAMADSEEGRRFRDKQLAFVKSLNRTLDVEGVPRTFFILGEYLDKCLKEFGGDYTSNDLKSHFISNTNLAEIQQHSYSHPIIKEIATRKNKYPISIADFARDIEKAQGTIERILGVIPFGLRVPLGYNDDLSEFPELLKRLKKAGIEYVSSNLRADDGLETHVTPERQPHNYGHVGQHGLVEIPSHGWQDVIFTKDKAKFYFDREPDTPEQIIKHYLGLLKQAQTLGLPAVSVALCLHPWALMEYDPGHEIVKKLCDGARKQGAEILPYAGVAREFKDVPKLAE